MKKTLIALSFVCAGALAFADNPQYNDSWFSGIGTGATITEAAFDLKATGGSWSGLTVDNACVESGALVLDLDKTDEGVAEEATFTVSDTAKGEAADAFPVQRIVVSGVFTPIAAEDLLNGTAMAAKKAKVGFAVVNVGGETDSYKYYAWVGGASEAESASAIDDWEELGVATDVTTAKTIVIDLDYSAANVVTAKFAVGADEAAATTLTGAALTTALADKVIASVSCTGSGTLNALSGAYQYAVAEAEGRKFGTAGEAIAAAQGEGGSGNVILRRNVNGEVSVSGWLRLHYDSSVSGRNENIQENFKVAEGSAQTTCKSNGGSELVDNWMYKEWVLPDDVLLNVKINGQQIGGGTFGGSLNSDFRDWLLKNCPTYRDATADASAIQDALVKGGTNGYLLWQSFVMGVDAGETVKLAPAATDEDDGIYLTLLNTIKESPFASKITYTISKNGGEPSTATSIGTRSSPVVKIPLDTGRYSVSFTIGE